MEYQPIIVPPPVDMQAPLLLAWAFTIAMFLQTIPTAFWYLRRSFIERSAVPIMAVLGGAAAGLGSGLIDHLSMIWWPLNIPLPAFRVAELQVPVFDVVGYCLFMGVGSFYVYEAIQGGKGSEHIWKTAAVFFIADLIYELPTLNLGLFEYYGPHPFVIAKFPIYWAFLNAMIVVAGGGLFYFLFATIGRYWYLAFCAPIMSLGVLLGISWPVFITLHMDVPAIVRWIAGGYAILGSVWMIRFVANVADDVALNKS